MLFTMMAERQNVLIVQMLAHTQLQQVQYAQTLCQEGEEGRGDGWSDSG